MACEEKVRLISEYHSAASKFSAAVTELHITMGTIADSLRQAISRRPNLSTRFETWRRREFKSEEVRIALEQHIAESMAVDA